MTGLGLSLGGLGKGMGLGLDNFCARTVCSSESILLTLNRQTDIFFFNFQVSLSPLQAIERGVGSCLDLLIISLNETIKNIFKVHCTLHCTVS